MKKILTASVAVAALVSAVAANAAVIVPAQYTTGTVAAVNEAQQTATIGNNTYYGVTGVEVGAETTLGYVLENGKRVVINVVTPREGVDDDNLLPVD